MQVPLGVLPNNEIYYDEMFQIMQHYQKYIPKIAGDNTTDIVSYHAILSGGDAFTCCRQRGLLRVMKNSDDQLKKCDGFIPVIEDWHTKVVLLEVYTCTYITL